MTKHIPVLLNEVREGLHLHNGMIVVDATLGGGGHTRMLLEAVVPTGKVVAFDTDQAALERFVKCITEDSFLRQASEEGRLVLVHRSFAHLAAVLAQQGIAHVDAIMADLGYSSDQIEDAERGLSFQLTGPLDMRLNQEEGQTAGELLATASAVELEHILREYGDEPEARRIARALVEARPVQPLMTTEEVRLLIEKIYPKRSRAMMKIHPATRTFQALRIAVNREREQLEGFLKQAVTALRPGGRLAIITFHSGEDKQVKHFFQEEARSCVCPPEFPVCRCGQNARLKILTKKPIIPTREESEENPRARSAKLRIAERLATKR